MKSVFALMFMLFFATPGCADPHYATPTSESAKQVFSLRSYDCSLQLKSQNLCLSWAWEKKPSEGEMGSLWIRTFKIDERDGFPRLVESSSALSVKLWMPSMGHGSSPVKVDIVETGTYRASNVYFLMPGRWQIKFQVFSGGNLNDEVVVDYTH